jgi:misacylated tRNA(Ala) deacylase
MNNTDPLFLKDAYLKEDVGVIKKVSPEFGISLDRSIFYPQGGGQPGDRGALLINNQIIEIINARKDFEGEIWLVPLNMEEIKRLEIGNQITQKLDWQTRYKYMRTHTALHLLSVCLSYPVTGGQITFQKGRLDFDMPVEAPDKKDLQKRLNSLIRDDYSISYSSISQKELDDRPELVKTMSVKPPKNTEFVRLVRIGDDKKMIDLQPCGGTHVNKTAEIRAITISKIEKKGRINRRVSVILHD